MAQITDEMRRARSSNISGSGREEVKCPSCGGKGSHVRKHTRVAGSHMNKHRAEKHGERNTPCDCPRSTVATTITCSRCGGYGTIPQAKEV